MAREHGPACIEKCVALMMHSDDERVQFAAAKELLDRGFGRTRQPLEVSDESPLQMQHLIAATRVAQLLQAQYDARVTNANGATTLDPQPIDWNTPALE